MRLTNVLVNVRAIINHFTPKVDSWAAVNHLSSLTEEQVYNRLHIYILFTNRFARVVVLVRSASNNEVWLALFSFSPFLYLILYSWRNCY